MTATDDELRDAERAATAPLMREIAKLDAENAQLRGVDRIVDQTPGYGPCACRWNRKGELRIVCFEHKLWFETLECIAGRRQPADNLLSNRDLALRCLDKYGTYILNSLEPK